MTVSVALAAYNGEKYIAEQLNSILPQLPQDGEIVVSVDPSEDNTKQTVLSFSDCDKRVKCIDGKGKGVIKNFENAILNCQNDIIFLCDQDDAWYENKIERVLKEFENESVTLVMHDAQITDGELNVKENSFFERRGTQTGIFKNIIKNSYIGCCMAFKKEMKDFILPFPENLPMHDQWIGLVCEKHGKVSLISEPLIKYRRHGENVSQMEHAGVITMIKWRINIICDLIKFGGKRK